jgi:RimJ/RimL family protein N-acetyltransferase
MNWNLETDHYYVRFAHEEDITNIYSLLSNNEVVKHVPKNPMVVEAQAMDLARRMVMQFDAKEAAFWLVEEKSSGKIIARLSLQNFNWVSASGRLQIEILPEYKTLLVFSELIYAVATLGFEDLSLHRLEWLLMTQDSLSIDHALSLNFNHDGQYLGYLEFEDEWVDYQVYSLLNTDEVWQQAVLNDGLISSK